MKKEKFFLAWREFEPQAAHLRPRCCESMQLVWNDECGLVPILSAGCMHHETQIEKTSLNFNYDPAYM